MIADSLGAGWAIAIVAALTGGSGVWVAMTRWRRLPTPAPAPVDRKTSAELLAEARSRIEPRIMPADALEAASHGALLIDIRSTDDRCRDGVIPGSLHIPRTVLEWRADPDSGYPNPHIGALDRQLILVCGQGFSSSLAAATMRDLGYTRATDLVGGFDAWKAAGLPVRPPRERDAEGLPGMAAPDPASYAAGVDAPNIHDTVPPFADLSGGRFTPNLLCSDASGQTLSRARFVLRSRKRRLDSDGCWNEQGCACFRSRIGSLTTLLSRRSAATLAGYV